MINKNVLRPVVVKKSGKIIKGFFHRYVYEHNDYYSTTRVLVELNDGKLKYFDPEFIQFTDRSVK